ncbi:MAG: hypothetical protein JWP74_1641 [Marmoricola sp.]|nr:hypothetical protein [Marmoricola sp.]
MDRLRPFEADLLRSAALTYPEVGATRGDLPVGYHHLEVSAGLGEGPELLARLGAALFSWGLQTGAGLHVRAAYDVVEEGAVAMVRLGPGPLSVRAPVRVVYVVDEDRRKGFAYGTLPGHAECGEELFLLELGSDDAVTLTIRAFSRPAGVLARLAGPLGRAVQRRITRRYLRALV